MQPDDVAPQVQGVDERLQKRRVRLEGVAEVIGRRGCAVTESGQIGCDEAPLVAECGHEIAVDVGRRRVSVRQQDDGGGVRWSRLPVEGVDAVDGDAVMGDRCDAHFSRNTSSAIFFIAAVAAGKPVYPVLW